MLYKHTHTYRTLSEYMRKKGESSVIKTRHIQEVWELFLLELIANQSPYVLRRCNQIGLCVHVCVCERECECVAHVNKHVTPSQHK